MPNIRRIYKIAITTALLAFSCSAVFCASKSYLEHVSDALAALEQGDTNNSAAALSEAITCNSGDPLAHTALGLTYASGGRHDAAREEFDQALNLDKDCAQAAYGKGLLCLINGQLGQAASCFGNAQAKDPNLPVEGAIEYVNAIESGTYKIDDNPGDDECLAAMNALALMSKNRHSEAAAVLKNLQQSASGDAFGERIGCAMSFLRSAPVHVSGWPIKDTDRSKSGAPKNLPEVSGTTTLKADLRKAGDVRIVTFFVDGRLVGMTNNPPFTYPWDTSRTANGVHSVKIVGCDSDGMILCDKTMQVIVRNIKSGGTADLVSGKEAAALWSRLWRIMRLKPSRAGINYSLAQCAIRLQDEPTAIDALERTIAANPNYLDASDLIAKLNAPNGNSAKLYGVKTNRRVIALTFDDGPKPDSGVLLDLLKEKGVKATFFVVGKQVEANPSVLKRMAVEGHDIQNHTYNHRALEFLSAKEVEQEIAAGSVCVRDLTGKGTGFIRPPGARAGRKLPEIVKSLGMTAVYWSANCVSFEGTTKAKMLHYAVSSAKPGGIILMHNQEGVTLQALPEIIDALRSKGYTFVTVSELANNAEFRN
ncbi:MAG: polysaccharide deacetylase family protein [Armatimonadota bacterium]|nr:polysaccharide deacetylase family protein [bacterium]